MKEREERIKAKRLAIELIDILEIDRSIYTNDDYCVNIVDLYNILTNETRLKELVSKLKMKAFW